MGADIVMEAMSRVTRMMSVIGIFANYRPPCLPIGSGKLSKGAAVMNLESVFGQTVNSEMSVPLAVES
ncbi:MAG: hypothetical protein WB817_04935 [Terriglobales bacterium]